MPSPRASGSRNLTGSCPAGMTTFGSEVAGRAHPVQRSYSVGSSPAPDPSVIDLGVREVPGGLLSSPAGRGPSRPMPRRARPPRQLHLDEGGRGSGLAGRGGLVLIWSAAVYDHVFCRDERADLAGTQWWLRLVHCITRAPTERRAHRTARRRPPTGGQGCLVGMPRSGEAGQVLLVRAAGHWSSPSRPHSPTSGPAARCGAAALERGPGRAEKTVRSSEAPAERREHHAR